MKEPLFWFHSNSRMLTIEKTITVFFCACQKKMPLNAQIKCDTMDVPCKSEKKIHGRARTHE